MEEELRAYQQEVATLRHENERLKKRVISLQDTEEDNDTWMMLNNSLQANIQQYKQQLFAADEAIAAAEEAATRAERQAAACAQQAEHTASEYVIRKLSKMGQHYQDTLAAAEGKATLISQQLEQLQREHGEVVGRLRDTEQQAAQAEERAAAEVQPRQAAQAAEARAAAEMKALQQALHVCQQSASSHQSGLSLKVTRLEGQLAGLKESEAKVKRRCIQLTRALGEKEAKVEEYRKAWQEAHTKQQLATEDSARLERLVQQEQQSATAAQQAVRSHKEPAAAAEGKATLISQQLEGLQREYGEVVGRWVDAEQEAAKQVQLCQAAQAAEARAAAEMKALQQALHVCQQSASSHQSGLSLKVTRLEEQLAGLKESEAKVKRRCNQLTRAMGEKTAKVEDYRQACEEVEAKLQLASQECTHLRRVLEGQNTQEP